MRFTKMHGAGNDYIYVNLFEEKISLFDAPDLAVRLSDRHFGIGSDGLILIGPSEKADFEMIMYNADGSRGEMCGNGIRCVGRYVYEHGLTDKTEVSVETLAGIKHLKLFTDPADGRVLSVRVDMGEPVINAVDIPVSPDMASFDKLVDGDEVCKMLKQADIYPVIGGDITVLGQAYKVTCVSMGNPHCIVFCEKDVMELDLEKIGPAWENHEKFPQRINTEFVNVLDRKHVVMRVWERGSGETLACGTGACAVVVASVLNGLTDSTVNVRLLGGDLEINWENYGKPVYMTGTATEVFTGEVNL